MEVKAVEEEKEEVSGGKEDIKELKGRKQQTENWNVLYIFVIFFSAWKLLPNKRLYNNDGFVSSSVIALAFPQSHLEAVCSQPVEKYELQRRNSAWQKERLVINSLPTRQGCSTPVTFAVCRKLAQAVPGEECDGSGDYKSVLPVVAAACCWQTTLVFCLII